MKLKHLALVALLSLCSVVSFAQVRPGWGWKAEVGTYGPVTVNGAMGLMGISTTMVFFWE